MKINFNASVSFNFKKNLNKELKHVLIQHIKNNHGQIIGTLVAKKIDDTVYVGWSKCHRAKDAFNKKIGIDLALTRIEKYANIAKNYEKDCVPARGSSELPHCISSNLPTFGERCRRYFHAKPQIYNNDETWNIMLNEEKVENADL
jgi:hypothetical protein